MISPINHRKDTHTSSVFLNKTERGILLLYGCAMVLFSITLLIPLEPSGDSTEAIKRLTMPPSTQIK
tara:strand:+ start:855 stop:1055 length:201 start_codon:yes stop_codon:yes gene_type:complete